MDSQNNVKTTVIINAKPKRRRLRVGDRDFVAPDGGWGWLIVFACGFSNLSTFPMFQQFGLVFRDKFQMLGVTESQTTTITNLISAFNAGVGLANGPVFKTFTYRQVSMVGSCLVALSLIACAFCSSFWMYIIFYSACYGSAMGLSQTANAIALNTYFKEKRRIATGLSWTTTALGPIVWPHIIVALSEIYGMHGVLVLFGGFAMHSFVCALLLQPVEWHTKFKEEEPEKVNLFKQASTKPQDSGKISRVSSKIFSSQYFGNENDPVKASYEIVDPGTPMMLRSNDGWYSLRGSRLSLASNKANKHSDANSMVTSAKPSSVNLVEYAKERDYKKKERKISSGRLAVTKEVAEDGLLDGHTQFGNSHNEKYVLKNVARKLAEYEHQQQLLEEPHKIDTSKPEEKLTLWRKISIFFDFELFKDLVYVNMMLGITLANFVELNFSILTPIIMHEFNFSKPETATFMSLLGGTDLVVRFFVPFVADKVTWSNKTFFLIGVMSMAIGRIILVHTQTYKIALIVAVIIGSGKALRTIFMALVIPSHVPLERLPAATGLQLAISGILFIILGPLVGWIRQVVGTYVITLHILNICTYITAIFWIMEDLLLKRKHIKEEKFSKKSVIVTK